MVGGERSSFPPTSFYTPPTPHFLRSEKTNVFIPLGKADFCPCVSPFEQKG